MTSTSSSRSVKLEGYNCVHCRGPLKSDRTLCGGCRGVYYCSPACQHAHWRTNHKIACQLYKHILTKNTTEDLPFAFPIKVKPGKMDDWLKQVGAGVKGVWRRESSESAKFAYGQLPALSGSEQEVWGLASEQLPAPLAHPLKDGQVEFPQGVLKNWTEYYAHRHLPMESPIAVMLSNPLTLYYALTQIVQNHKRIKNKKHLEIFILGPERELDECIVFEELAHLIPDVELNFNFVGPMVPTDFKYEAKNPRVTFKFHRAKFHELTRLAYQPDLAFISNAGLENQDETWRPTVLALTKQKIPAIFTENSETSTLNATRLFATVGAKEGFQVKLNPFRSPIWKESDMHAMPCYDNGYLQAINI